MAEFCLDCLNKLSNEKYSAFHYHISRDLDLCEECGEYKHVVICRKKWSLFFSALSEIPEVIRFRIEERNKDTRP